MILLVTPIFIFVKKTIINMAEFRVQDKKMLFLLGRMTVSRGKVRITSKINNIFMHLCLVEQLAAYRQS